MAKGSAVAIVTGAASGIGRASAERLARNGWSVVAADVNVRPVEVWAEDVDNVVVAKADVSLQEDNQSLVELADETFGGLDTVVLNAGIATSASIESMTIDQFRHTLDVNLLGAVHGIRSALPFLRKSADPTIVVTSSMNGLGGDNSMAAYCSSKFGLVGLVMSLARELSWEGIRINAVCPGAIRTGMTIPFEQSLPEAAAAIAAQVPLGRWGEADEVAAVVEFLASPASSYVNGIAIPVDGGASTGTGLRPVAHSAEEVLSFDYA